MSTATESNVSHAGHETNQEADARDVDERGRRRERDAHCEIFMAPIVWKRMGTTSFPLVDDVELALAEMELNIIVGFGSSGAVEYGKVLPERKVGGPFQILRLFSAFDSSFIFMKPISATRDFLGASVEFIELHEVI
jgi:hypothetical protein